MHSDGEDYYEIYTFLYHPPSELFWEAVSHDSTEAAVAGDVVKGKRKSPNEGFMNEHQRHNGR